MKQAVNLVSYLREFLREIICSQQKTPAQIILSQQKTSANNLFGKDVRLDCHAEDGDNASQGLIGPLYGGDTIGVAIPIAGIGTVETVAPSTLYDARDNVLEVGR